MSETIKDLLDPVRRLSTDPEEEPTDGVAVCLSGGGYRAMLDHQRDGVYAGIRSDITNYRTDKRLPAPVRDTTRLMEMPARDQDRLINWGYAIADAGLRAHLDGAIEPPDRFPYPGGGQ